MPLTRCKSILLAAAGLCLLFRAAAAPPSSDPVFRQIQSIVKTLSEISGLAEEHLVPYGRMNKRQLRHFLAKRIRKSVKPEEIRADELTLKMFGFVPKDYNLERSTMNLLTEQAAAFYDYDEKRLYLVDDAPISSEVATLAHELSHALADQHFNLGNYMDDKPASDDETLARTAVVEGQASWLMLAFSLKQAGRQPELTREMIDAVMRSDQPSDNDYPELAEAPLYIRESLLFPYTRGIEFFDAVYKQMRQDAFAAVFRDPPVATSQILHPERYFNRTQPSHPAVPEVKGLSMADEVSEGTVGEFDHQMLLQQFAGQEKARSLAPHVKGGQFQIGMLGKKGLPVLRYSSEWDGAEKAREFFDLYPRILNGKWSRCTISLTSPTMIAGTGDNGLFVASLNGNLFSSVEGLNDPAEWERLKNKLSAATIH